MMIPQSILVTGGAGLIGSHTVHFLLEQGSCVTVLDNLSSGLLNRLPLSHPRLRFIQGDILDFAKLTQQVVGCDAVLHLAAIASVNDSLLHPISSMQVNTQGLVHLFEAIRLHCHTIPFPRIVYASSAAVYGDRKAGQLCCDDDPTQFGFPPLSPYSAQKIHCETYAALYQKVYNIPSLGLRYFNVYHVPKPSYPSTLGMGVIHRFLQAYYQSKPCILCGDGKQSRDFIHVLDIARANQLALQNQYCGILNIATGQTNTLFDLIRCLEQKLQCRLHYECIPARINDISYSCATTEKAEKELKFKYTISLEEGIKQL